MQSASASDQLAVARISLLLRDLRFLVGRLKGLGCAGPLLAAGGCCVPDRAVSGRRVYKIPGEPVERARDGVAGSVGRCTGALRPLLSGRSISVLRPSSMSGREKGTPLCSSSSMAGTASHILDGVLVAEPVQSLHRGVHMETLAVRENRQLAALRAADEVILKPILDEWSASARTVLHDPGEIVGLAYFPRGPRVATAGRLRRHLWAAKELAAGS